jgi:phosphatidylglycerol:prolipoprotein diacylglycerol transferase
MALMHPIFLRIGPLEIRYYGLMYVISFIVGYFLVRAMSKRKGLPLKSEDILDIFLVTIPLGIIFARLYYVAFNWEFYRRAPWEIPAVWHGGLAIHGGLLGGVLGLLLSAKWKKVPFWSLADVAVPAVALGQVFGRIGNFLNGDAFGTPTTLPWGVVFPLDSPAGAAYPGQPLHPAMLYEAVGNLLIFFALWRLSKVPARPGFLAALYFVLYGLVRFPCEFVRGDALWLGPFRAAQVASVLLILGFGSWLILAKPWRVAPKPKSK